MVQSIATVAKYSAIVQWEDVRLLERKYLAVCSS